MMKKRLLSLLLVLVLAFTLVPSAFAAGCGVSSCVCPSSKSCHMVSEWVAYSSTLHWYVNRCSGCGQIDFNWSSQAPHSFDADGVCTVCGYMYVEPCYHSLTHTEWNGCNWYEYCDDCGALVSSGTSHSYSYGGWTYYNSSQHSRTATCTRCGSTTTSYGSHSTTTRYNTYSSTQHKVQKYCSACSSYIGSASYESHSFTYGDWQDYSEAIPAFLVIAGIPLSSSIIGGIAVGLGVYPVIKLLAGKGRELGWFSYLTAALLLLYLGMAAR